MERILIVEDDDSWMDFCATILEPMGFAVDRAQNRMQALKRLEGVPYDIVLTDLCLPAAEDGKAVVLGTKSRHPGTDVILMTATPSLDTAIAILKDGAYDYIVKPFTPDYLQTVLNRCLEKRRSQQELSVEKALREEVQAAYSQLRKVERLKEAFLSRISHELNTPLAEALMAMTLLDGHLPKEGRGRSQLKMAVQAVERLRDIVRDLLDFVDLHKEDLTLKAEPISIPQLVGEVAEAEKRLLEPKGLRVSLKFPPDLPSVPGDPELLKRALRQLFLNAIHFNKPGGQIELSAKEWENWIFVHVKDEGEGVPNEHKDEIFDSFYQLADFMTRTVGGLGLGLAITKKIVEAHGGSISVDSAPGQGSDFKVCLPKQKTK
ncbi:MAG: hypothetical protein A2X36_12885 [Elusimicrobia bacterium GWA2_69_24]|nr:MAG: hypothetical protein A2X36_12885 [Elusimicrobia bacterium GWA2_69_24]